MTRLEFIKQQLMNALQFEELLLPAYLEAVEKWEKMDTKITFEIDMYYQSK